MEALNSDILFNTSDPIWKLRPFQHQEEMARFHYRLPYTGDGSDVGVGKTPGMITVIQRLVKEGHVRRCLVIMPNTILENWANELKNWSDLSHVILRGTKDKRIALMQQPKLADVYLINYEGVRVVFPQLAMMHFDMIVCDEIHHIKSPSAEQTKLILKLARNTPYRKGMTGTLLTNNLMDLWSICQFINPAIFSCNQWGYRNRFLYNENATKSWLRFPSWVPRPGAAEEIKKIIEPHFIRFKKREVLKFLPPVLFQRRNVTMVDEQRRVYNQLKKDYVTELDSGAELAALQILPRLTKLLEITSGFVYREGETTYRFEKNAKLTELKNILEEIGDSKAVIWIAYKENAALVGQTLIEMGRKHAFITGATKQESRQELVDQFNRDELQYLVCSAACAGEGLNILAPYSIYYSRNWKLGERLQSLGRSDRPGAERWENVTVIDLVTEDSADEKVLASLYNKDDLRETINPESFRRMLTQ